MSDLLKKKSSFGVLPKELIAQTKAPPTERYSLSRTNAIREKRTIRGATLNSRLPVRLAEIPSYLPATDVCQHVAGYSAHKTHFAAPSAVHLTMCILPDFQHRRLSVKASLPLSPLQRFNILLNFSQYTTRLYKCQESILSLFFFSDDSFFLFIRIMRM